ncbi:hypothetical protein JKG47_11270 [Acidithiobacillus sp. MC6.1]|nr:hypothetical protein [Acidithiobacillus sp. MC6.1]
MFTKRSGTDELAWNQQKRHELIRVLSDNQRLAEQLIVDTSAGRWHVALTALRRGLGKGKPGQALARFISGMVGSVDNAYTDFLEDIKVAGHERDVLVSWAFDKESLKQEVDMVRKCLDHAGILDESAFKDVRLSGSVDVEAVGAKVSYDNAKHELGVGLHVKLGNMLKAIGVNVGGELVADWKTVLPHRDSRENLLAAIISIESQSGTADVTCRNVLETKRHMAMLEKEDNPIALKIIVEEQIPAMKEYLLSVLDSIEPEIRRAVDSTGYAGDELYYVLFKGAIHSVLTGNYEGAFSAMGMFESAYMPIQRAVGPNVYLMAGALYMLAEVDALGREGAKVRLNHENAHQAQETRGTAPVAPAHPRPRMRR